MSDQSAATGVSQKTFWIIFAIVFTDLLGFGIVFPLLPSYTRLFNINEAQVGLMLGVYSLMQFVFAPILGRLSDRIGRRPVLLVSMAGTFLSFLMLAFAQTFWFFFLARALDGIAGSNLSTAQAYIADISPKEQRTRNLGMWIGAAFGLGFAIGPALGALFQWVGSLWFPQFGPGFPFLIAGLLGIANLLFAWGNLPESLQKSESQHAIGRRTSSWQTIKNTLGSSIGPLILAYAISILAFAKMEGTFSFISKDVFGMNTTMIYVLFAYLGIVMSVVQGGLVRRLAPIMGDKAMSMMGCAMMVIALATLPLGHQMWTLFLTAGLLAAGEAFANPALISSISKSADDSLQGETLGVNQSLASLSRFLGPAMAGFLYQTYGPASPYFVASAIMLLAIYATWLGFKNLNQPQQLALQQ
jgi:MFS transporter, DHA1 family, tetracycline resistance protein